MKSPAHAANVRINQLPQCSTVGKPPEPTLIVVFFARDISNNAGATYQGLDAPGQGHPCC